MSVKSVVPDRENVTPLGVVGLTSLDQDVLTRLHVFRMVALRDLEHAAQVVMLVGLVRLLNIRTVLVLVKYVSMVAVVQGIPVLPARFVAVLT